MRDCRSRLILIKETDGQPVQCREMSQENQFARLGLFKQNAPRYTSYPSAPQFGPGVQAPHFRRWLENVAPGSAVSLYVHIPFCRRLCWFCACRTQGVRSDRPVLNYLHTVEAEIARVADALPDGVVLSRLHWGGGTPTILPPEGIASLAATIRERLPFAPGAEFSVEIDPSEVDDPRLDALADAGMNRASIGVQDFAPEIQRAIGREQSFEITEKVARSLRARDINSLNADMLYGLPFQDERSIAETTRKVLALEPDRVALYGYAHVPWMARRQVMIRDDTLPDAEQRLELSEIARDVFRSGGFNAIGIDHFARPGDGLDTALRAGTLRRNFQGYTDDTSETLIGTGASAISRFSRGYVQNAAATPAYLGQVESGGFAGVRGHEFSTDDRIRGHIIERLMCLYPVDFDRLEPDFGPAATGLTSRAASVHETFRDFTTLAGNVFAIKPEGRSLTRLIAREFDAYFASGSGHSMAI